jgi:hypothetical protein
MDNLPDKPGFDGGNQSLKQWYIAIGVAIFYLAVSLAFSAWSWSWIIWVGYAAYRFLESRRSHG